jgi:hypothetical protein
MFSLIWSANQRVCDASHTLVQHTKKIIMFRNLLHVLGQDAVPSMAPKQPPGTVGMVFRV